MGHVLVVRAAPQMVSRQWFQEWDVNVAWPANNVTHIWKVPTIESTRCAVGLHRCEMLVHIQLDGTLVLLGELATIDGGALEFSQIDEEAVEIWQSPAELRSQLSMECMHDVLSDMVSCEASWSFTTAARAVFKSGKLSRRRDLLRKVQGYWDSAPICTSVVIAFWQRYLCRFAKATGQRETDLIMKWMPLKADRVLPGELITTMRKCGWVNVTCVPKMQSSESSARCQTLLRAQSFDIASWESSARCQTPLRAHSFDTVMSHRAGAGHMAAMQTPLRAHSFDTVMSHRAGAGHMAASSFVSHQHGLSRTTSFIVASR